MATTFDAILRIGARVQGVGDVRALSAAMRQVADETRQVAALERAQANLARVLLDNQKAAAATERERAAFATQRLQLSLKVAETEYTATIKQLAAQKELQAAQVKAAADRVRAADAAMKGALVVTNAMRSEKAAAQENLQIQVQKARAQYESINNAKQIASLERETAIATAQGTAAARQRAEISAQKARVDAATFAAFRAADQQAAQQAQQRAQAESVARQQTIAGLQSIRNLAIGAAAALGAVGVMQIAGNIIQAGQEAELTQRRIEAVAGPLGEVAGVYEIAARGAKQFAISNIDSQQSVANLYNRLRPMGVTLGQIETVYSSVNKAALLGGLSAYDASEAFRQLGQAMGSGRLQGDELRSLMERMPAIGVAVAKVMKVSVGEIKQLGSEGQITTDVILKAVAELDKLEPPEPTALQRYGAAVKDLSTAFGEQLLPKMTPAIQSLTDFVISASANADKLVDIVSSIVTATAKIQAGIMGIIRGEPMETAAIWKQIDEIANRAKVEAVNRELAETGVSKAAEEYNRQLNVAQSTQEELAAAKERQAAIEKEILEAQRQAVDYVDVQFQQVERINSAAAARAEGMRDVAQQTLSVEQAQIDVARAILDGKMSMATSDQERLSITRQIAELDRQAAQANYNAAMAQIEAEQQLEKIRVINAENNFRRARAAYDIAVQLGTLTADIIGKLESARAELGTSAVQNVAFDRSIGARTQVAGYQLQAANIRTSNAMNQPMQSGNAGVAGGLPIAPGNNFFSINGQVLSGIPAFAKGAHVKGPTLAWIGEGGEGESVVPDSKRVGFAMNVLSGMTGSAAIPKFAKGGYIAGENPRNRGWVSNIGRGSGSAVMDEYNRRIGIAAQQESSNIALDAKKNQIARELGLDPAFGDKPMLNNRGITQRFYGSGSSVSSMSLPRETKVAVEMKAQEVAPDMFLVNGSEVRRMALEVAQQAIGQNNAQQRQPSARRRQGVR